MFSAFVLLTLLLLFEPIWPGCWLYARLANGAAMMMKNKKMLAISVFPILGNPFGYWHLVCLKAIGVAPPSN